MLDHDIRESLERRSREQARHVDREVASPLLSLAHRYRQAAGTAFAAGNDADAARFREAAAKLDAIAAELPALPVATR